MPSPAVDSPTRPPNPNPFGLGFRPPAPDSLPPNPIPSPASSPEQTGDLVDTELDEQGSGDDWSNDEESDSPDAISSAGSTRVANPLAAEGLRDMFRGGVVIASAQAHNALARTEGQRAVGLYLADEEDAERIGDPLARVAGRHQSVGKVNPDTADLLAAMVGLTRYATKQISRATEAKQLDGAAAGPQPMPEPVDL